MSTYARRAAAFALLAAVCAAVLLAPFAPHTDDGCQTEVHCLACRLAVTGHSVAAAAHPGAAIALVVLGIAAAPPCADVAHGQRAAHPSRGPPAFA
jgi:hypothetical protein